MDCEGKVRAELSRGGGESGIWKVGYGFWGEVRAEPLKGGAVEYEVRELRLAAETGVCRMTGSWETVSGLVSFGEVGSGYFVEALSEVRRAFDGNRTGGIGVGRWVEEKEGTLSWSFARPATHEQTADQALETGVC